jgi:hypothetical protein
VAVKMMIVMMKKSMITIMTMIITIMSIMTTDMSITIMTMMMTISHYVHAQIVQMMMITDMTMDMTTVVESFLQKENRLFTIDQYKSWFQAEYSL